MADLSHLFGSCACERNQYTVIIPASSASQAQVFFDNTSANRRSQAAPVTAWLRVPLEWYHSTTYAQFPDETHSSIRRTFNTPAANPALAPTRRQFCGYCGTHLTAWNEGLHGHERSSDVVDVTLGSLLNESLNRLEALQLYSDIDEESESGLVKDEGATINEEDHIATNEESIGGVDGPAARAPTSPAQRQRQVVSHQMQGRGLPYFEEMVENSRLGRIKRQKGGHTSDSADGARTVEWEVIEIGGDEEDQPMADTGGVASVAGGNKRIKIDP